MKKILLYSPKFMILNYLKNNFSTITVEEYFLLVGKNISFQGQWIRDNEILSSSPEVLLNEIKNNPENIDYFKNSAFTKEVIDEIIIQNVPINKIHLENRPNLRYDSKLYKKLLENHTLSLSDLKVEEVDEEVLDILDKQDFKPTIEEIKKYKILTTRHSFVNRLLRKDPYSLLSLERITKEDILIAMDSGFKAKKEDYELHPSLKKCKELLLDTFKTDKSVVVFFTKDMLNEYIGMEFEQDGSYILTIDDLKVNPNLGSLSQAMNLSIKHNPELIKYVKEGSYIDYHVIEEALKEVTITESDLEENPDITKIADIIWKLPNLKLYSSFLTLDEKCDAIERIFRDREKLTDEKLPFLKPKFGSKADSKKLISLSQLLLMHIDEDDINLQKKYSDRQHMVLDASSTSKYEEAKNTYRYPNVVVLNDSIISSFDEAIKTNSNEPILNIINDIYMFTKQTIDLEEIRMNINSYFEFYKKNNDLDKLETIKFYNRVLNMHRSFHISRFKTSLEKDLQRKLELTEKKKKTIIQGKKIEYVRKCVFMSNLSPLNVTIHELVELRDNAINTIINNKDIKKKGIQINEYVLKSIANESLKNKVTKDYVGEKLGIDDKEVLSYIIRQFDKIIFKLAQNIDKEKVDLKINLQDLYKVEGLNYNNFKIADQNMIYKIISNILMDVTEEEIDSILKQEHVSEILPLLPLVNSTSSFNMKTFINILKTYDRVRDKVSSSHEVSQEENLLQLMLRNLDDVMYLANAYASVNDIEKYALTEKTVTLLEERNISSYAKFYLTMLNRTSSNVPPIRITTDVASYISADNYDPDRLAIGKKPSNVSCIDLHNNAGVYTYKELLTGNMADVIICRNEFNKTFDNRIMVIRRGNVIQLLPQVGAQGFVSIEDLKQIADQIIRESISHNDNIDYVFVNGNAYLGVEYPQIKDSRFMNKFPHADTFIKATLLSSKNMLNGKPDEYKFDFDAGPEATYMHPRRKVNTVPNENEITRLRALNILLTENKEQKENLSRTFEPFYMKEYLKVVCGQDWYIAVRKDGSIETICLPTITQEGVLEYEEVKNLFIREEKSYAL